MNNLGIIGLRVCREPVRSRFSIARSASKHLAGHRLLAIAAFWTLLSPWNAAVAGGGPENVILVANPRSASSLCLANHYIRLRQIPTENLLFVPWDPKLETTDIDTFRKSILLPILSTIHNRGLQRQIDYVVYSSDFPWGIRLDADISKFLEQMRRAKQESERSENNSAPKQEPPLEWPKELTAVGSLNGLTYLWQPVMIRHPAYLSMQANHFMRLPIPEQSDASTTGFRAVRWYNRKGQVVEGTGQRYLLSTMLGVTAGRGNSVKEILDGLRRSAGADGTRPKGTIYFVENEDVRSKVRHNHYPRAVRALRRLDVHAEILKGTVPLNKNDVQGLLTGTASFDWKTTGSTILPGAICDNFTSFGGVLSDGAGQTPLSEFLRFGAAGASGTVTEPYAIADKFPSPMLQVHYARGCTLAESFYQSIYCPYQLLVVGDPLCRPWADIPRVYVSGAESGTVVQGSLTLRSTARTSETDVMDHFELFVDNVRVAECKAGGLLEFDTAKFPDGYHLLRVVAVGLPPIETQGRLLLPLRFSNHGRKIEASLATKPPFRADQPLAITVQSPGAAAIVAVYGSHVVGHINGDVGQIDIPANTFGAGPVQLRIASLGKDGPASNALADPLDLNFE